MRDECAWLIRLFYPAGIATAGDGDLLHVDGLNQKRRDLGGVSLQTHSYRLER
jgi:hypothetical protein